MRKLRHEVLEISLKPFLTSHTVSCFNAGLAEVTRQTISVKAMNFTADFSRERQCINTSSFA